MTLEFEDRLWLQLEAAADREAGRGWLRREAATWRAALTARHAAAAAAALATVAVVLAIVSHLPQRREPPPWRVGQFRVDGSDLGAGVTGYGSLWTYDDRTSALLRVDPRSHRVLARLALPTSLPTVAVAAGAGAVWATAVAPITHSPTGPLHPSPVALVRIDPHTNRVTARIPLRASDGTTMRPVGMVIRPDAVWVWGRGAALRVDPARDRVTAAITLGDETISGFVAADAWTAVFTDLGRLLTFDAGTGARVHATDVPVTVNAGQKLIATGGGVVVYAQGGALQSVDPRTGRVRWTVDLHNRPTDLTVTAGRLWVLLGTPGRDRLIALDPSTGRALAHVTLPSGDARSVATAGKSVLVTTEGGKVITVRPR
jgi:outer membrane protein assembly factor BamB